jgi:small subunit ribosomal protein S7
MAEIEADHYTEPRGRKRHSTQINYFYSNLIIMAQKRVQFIPAGSNPLQEKFISTMMLDGKKSTARNIWKNTLIEIGEKTGKNPEDVFQAAMEQVKPAMEVRPKRVGGSVYQIPFEVKPNRQISLAFRWILDASRKIKGKSMYKKLASTLVESSEGQGPAVKKREDTQRMADSNKAFAHMARY